MKSLSRILKPEQTVTGSVKVGVYQPSAEEFAEAEQLAPGIPGFSGQEEAEKGYALISETKRKILEHARNQAEQSASAILEDAYSQRDRIVNMALKQAEEIKEATKKEGYEEGLAAAEEDLARQISEIRGSLEEMGSTLGRQNQELKDRVVEFSLKIAEKILCKKLEEDESAIADMVERAVLTERDKRSVVVHLSDKSMGLIETLEKKLAPFREKNDGFLRIRTEEQPPGHVRIETEEGIVDASVFVQLENLKKQLAAFGKQT